MKPSNHFKDTIQAYLDQRAANDTLFEWVYTSNPNKNIDDCITYILNTVQQSGCNGFHDDEIFGMAVHYYDEPNIEIGKPMSNAKVAVNHVVVLTEEEKQQARQEAMQRAENEAYNKMMKSKPKTKKVALNPQPSLFDF